LESPYTSENSILTTEQKTIPELPEKAVKESTGKTSDKPPQQSAKGRNRRRKRPQQNSYDHIPIIIFLVVIFSFTLLGIGIGLTRYLDSERAGIPACGRVPCPPPFATAAPQKGAGE
jgi:hypothetical protein